VLQVLPVQPVLPVSLVQRVQGTTGSTGCYGRNRRRYHWCYRFQRALPVQQAPQALQAQGPLAQPALQVLDGFCRSCGAYGPYWFNRRYRKYRFNWRHWFCRAYRCYWFHGNKYYIAPADSAI